MRAEAPVQAAHIASSRVCSSSTFRSASKPLPSRKHVWQAKGESESDRRRHDREKTCRILNTWIICASSPWLPRPRPSCQRPLQGALCFARLLHRMRVLWGPCRLGGRRMAMPGSACEVRRPGSISPCGIRQIIRLPTTQPSAPRIILRWYLPPR